MKNIILISAFTLLTVLLISFQSCKKEDENEPEDSNETKNSSYNSSSSHNMGQNCMNCHKSGGAGEGWFNLAGTVYDSLLTSTYANATLKLYTGPNATGTLKYTIQVDSKGNFYTTDHIDFTGGLYPVMVGNTTAKYMGSAITMGQCNSCHGVSTNKLWTK